MVPPQYPLASVQSIDLLQAIQKPVCVMASFPWKPGCPCLASDNCDATRRVAELADLTLPRRLLHGCELKQSL